MIQEQLRKDLITAMKEHNTMAKNVLSLVIGEIQSAAAKKEISPAEEVAIITKVVKSIKETIVAGKSDNRNVETLEQEQALLSKYLPQNASDDQIKELIGQVDFTNAKSDGQKIGMIMKKIKEMGIVADSNRVRELVATAK